MWTYKIICRTAAVDAMLLPRRGISAREPQRMEVIIVGSTSKSHSVVDMNKILILTALSFIITMALPSYGQSRKELKTQVEVLQAQVGSLQTQVENLQAQLRQLQKYDEALTTQNKALKKRIESIRKCIIEATSDIPTTSHNAMESACIAVSHTNSISTSKTTAASTSTSLYGVPRKTSSSSSSSYSGSNGRTIYTGPRGGRYYINSKGNKVYIKR